MKKYTTLSAITLLILALSCNSANEKQAATTLASPEALKLEDYRAADTSAMANYEMPQVPPQEGNKQQSPDQKPSGTHTFKDWNKKIIKTGTLDLEVKDYKKFELSTRDLLTRVGGYIAGEERNESSYSIVYKMTLKVPVEKFDETMNALSPDSGKILNKKVTSEDVTGEIIDTKGRLDAKLHTRLRYFELLKQAKNMEEILLIQNELNELQEQMESASGRIQYLTHASAMSTIQLTFTQILDATVSDIHNPGFGMRLVNALQVGLQWVGDFLIILVGLWPLWIGLVIIWWCYKKMKGQRTSPRNNPIQGNASV